MDRLEAIAFVDLLEGRESQRFQEALAEFKRHLDDLERLSRNPPPGAEPAQIETLAQELTKFRDAHGGLEHTAEVPEASWRLYETIGYAGAGPPTTRWYRLENALQAASFTSTYPHDHVDYTVARAVSPERLAALPFQTAAWIRNTVSSSDLEQASGDRDLRKAGTLRVFREVFDEPTVNALATISEPTASKLREAVFESQHYELIVATNSFQLGRTTDLEMTADELFEEMDDFSRTISALVNTLEQEFREMVNRDVREARLRLNRANALVLLPLTLAIGLFTTIERRRRRWNREMVEAAERDPLTGLANRVALQRTTGSALLEPHDQTNTHAGVLLVDLDNFKAINDAFGHHVGDSVLKQFAARLESCVHPDEFLFRLGGDEFVFLVLGDTKLLNRLEAIAEQVAALSTHPLQVDEHELRVECSCGASIRHLPTDLSELLVESDLALHEIKEDDKGRYLSYSQTKRGPIIRRLPAILDRDGLEFVFQPQVDLASGAVVGIEGLCRWPTDDDASGPSLPYVSPIDIVDSAEWLGATERFLQNLITKYTQANALLGSRFDGVFWLNIWPSQLLPTNAAELFVSHFEASGIPLDRIGIEITEKLPLADEARAIRTIQSLRDAGVQVALDDFGVFNASIERLTNLPLDAVKLDQRLVRGVAQSPELQLFVHALCSICSNRGLTLIAEGVEDGSDLEALATAGLDRIQGFLVAAAMPPDALLDFLEQWDPQTRLNRRASSA